MVGDNIRGHCESGKGEFAIMPIEQLGLNILKIQERLQADDPDDP